MYRLGSTPGVHLMIRTKYIEDQLRQGRLDAKTLDSMFRRRIEDGANFSPFVSKAILATVKGVFPIGPDEAERQLGLGQIQLLIPDSGDIKLNSAKVHGIPYLIPASNYV